MSYTSFRKTVWAHYKKNGRHDLPWRKTRDPYRILVSEVMLQQTQVERVIPYYKNFLEKFPTPKALATASLAEVLKAWQGLGYNRRAKMLWQAAKEVTKKYRGIFPKTAGELEELPGIGPYTARAVATFAHNDNSIFIETNIRTVITHHFFSRRRRVADTELVEVLTRLLPKGKAREWYAALMDYGSYLKRSGVKLNAKSKHYTKQKQFKGSDREARGAILRELAKGNQTQKRLTGLLGDARVNQIKFQLTKLRAEGLIERRGKIFTLPH
ncbi:MAG TPA: A/G-specific adenine glycosylase [Candidatus Paceibacterota bacterium]|nr:A/G-specific adenine glycosylase [Candidatus Paceibacterota bacterium]